jgi:hypothetical protein
MYLAEYNIAGTSWVQAAITLEYPGAHDASRAERWWTRFETLLRGLDAIPQVSASLRVTLDASLHAVLFASGPLQHVEAFRRAAGSFTQLDVVADSDVTFARDRAEHDARLRFPPYQCRIALPRLTRGDAWFAFDFRVSHHLNELLLEAHTLKHELSYHINIEPTAIDTAAMREAARNALRVSEIAGVPASLEQLQQELAGKLRRATHLSEEFVGVTTMAARTWLSAALDRRVRAAYGQYVAAELTFDEEDHEGSLTAMRHRAFFEPIGVDEVCGGAITPDERAELLAWRPGSALLDLIERAGRTVDVERPGTGDYSGMPDPYGGTQPYAFISYKHEDLDSVKRLLGRFAGEGRRIWYDRGIPGGVEWDALIEERVRHCGVVLLFVSQAAVRSKYVRREVKFADVLNKPIVGIRLEPDIDLSDGMAMLLNQYQVVDASGGSLQDELDRALRVLSVFPDVEPA